MKRLILFLLILFQTTPLYAGDELLFFKATSFKCSFTGEGLFTTIDNGKFKSKDVKKMEPIIFDSINHEKRSARMIGNQGSSNVGLILSPTTLNIIEMTGAGGISITSIFNPVDTESNLTPKNKYIAVHSRHIAPVVGSPMLSQRYGNCEIWNVDR